MLKRILLLNSLIFALTFAAAEGSRAAAQSRKPSQALRQVAEYQRRALEKIGREAADAQTQTDALAGLANLDEMNEELIKFAAERASAFKLDDWKGEELYALAGLYQLAEQFAPAAEAYREFLNGDPKSKFAPFARAGLVRALIETERLEEAEKLLASLELAFVQEPAEMAARASLYRDLAVALRDRNLHEQAGEMARRGYTLADSLTLSSGTPPGLRESAEQNQVVLAALAVASRERAGRKREAADLNELVREFDFKRRPELLSVYESELASARLIGGVAPELAISRWVEGEPKTLSELRGKVVLLDFWAMWCGPCVVAFPHFRQFQTKYGDRGLEIIGVTKLYGRSDAEESLSREQELKSLQAYKARHKLAYLFAVGKMDDVTNEERYGVIGLPTVILIDRRGRVRSVKRGVGEYRGLEKQIKRLINEK